MIRIIALSAFAALLCSCSRSGAIVVASKNFTEQVLLGEIAAQQLERKLHIPVERKLNLGGTLLTHEAIVKGDIDVYPEYTGTASSVVLKQTIPEDPVRAYMVVKDAYLQRFKLVWLPPLGFNDTFAMVVRARGWKKAGCAAVIRGGVAKLALRSGLRIPDSSRWAPETGPGLRTSLDRHSAQHGFGAALSGIAATQRGYGSGQFDRCGTHPAWVHGSERRQEGISALQCMFCPSEERGRSTAGCRNGSDDAFQPHRRRDNARPEPARGCGTSARGESSSGFSRNSALRKIQR